MSSFYQQVVMHPYNYGSPQSSTPHNSQGFQFPQQNTVAFPLGDVTNSPTPVPSTARKRKRAIATSGNPAPPKVKQTPRSSSTTNPRVSVAAAASCGVGPSPAPSTPIRPNDTPVTPAPTPIPTPHASASTQQPDAAHNSRKHTGHANNATDVYFFMRPLKSEDAPEVLPSASTGSENLTDAGLLTEKPTAEHTHVGCRLCPTWKVWKNTPGGLSSNLRTHLIAHHGPIYYPTCRRLGLKHAAERQIAKEQEPFTLEGWIDRLLRWIVVDDQRMREHKYACTLGGF
ncbi:hypothetical protein C8J57DRAFT_1243435 [Mycena rebaudengoi]|nr:hypothetical protein C8J57DRAFT_1243435 [Mycena rebaudengoi]